MKEFDPIESNAVHAAMELTKVRLEHDPANVDSGEIFSRIYASIIEAIKKGRKD